MNLFGAGDFLNAVAYWLRYFGAPIDLLIATDLVVMMLGLLVWNKD